MKFLLDVLMWLGFLSVVLLVAGLWTYADLKSKRPPEENGKPEDKPGGPES